MATQFDSRTFLVATCAGGVVAAVVAGWLVWQGWFDKPSVDTQTSPFLECANEVGLAFQMRFLPNEQGEAFKINLYDHGCGLAVGDYDGDGKDDLYFTNQLGRNALYRNQGDGTFADVTAKAGVPLGDRICVGATFADYDNDGDQDLFVTSTRGGNVLFRNRGDGTFADVTQQAGVGHVGHPQTAVFFDYDNDGFLDLFVTNTAEWTTAFDAAQGYYPGKTLGGGADRDLLASPKEGNLLYRNQGDGTFRDVTVKAGLKGRGWSGDAAVLDFNEDGHPDLLVGNMFGPSQLYRNNGDGRFSDVTRETLEPTPYGTCGVRAFDFNNDGKLDVFLADMHSDMWTGLDFRHESLSLAREGERRKYPHLAGPLADLNPALKERDQLAAEMLGYRPEEVVFGNTLFKNLGGGRFEEVSGRANLETFWPWGVATGDFDNNGFEDAFLPSGMGYPFYYWPNQLMMNNGNETFTDRSHELGVEPPRRGLYLAERVGGRQAVRSSRSAAVADFDGDGRLEIVTNNFNDQPYYFRNTLPRQNYIAFRLQGTGSNRDAIGAVVKLHAGQGVQTCQVSSVGGYLAQSSRTAHFGLGDRTRVDRVEVRWPSGVSQEIAAPAVNRLHEVVEPRKP